MFTLQEPATIPFFQGKGKGHFHISSTQKSLDNAQTMHQRLTAVVASQNQRSPSDLLRCQLCHPFGKTVQATSYFRVSVYSSVKKNNGYLACWFNNFESHMCIWFCINLQQLLLGGGGREGLESNDDEGYLGFIDYRVSMSSTLCSLARNEGQIFYVV